MNISVIIPVWNRPVEVLRALKSVVTQTYSVQEVIVIDDGSTDTTLERVQEYSNNIQSPTINIFSIDHCGMPGKVRNFGIEKAGGEWIAFLDSDDEWCPDKIQKQVETLEQGSLLWCHTRERWIRGSREISQKKQRHNREGNIFEDSLKKCIVGPSTVLLNKTLIEECGGFREDLEIAEDYELWLRITMRYPIAYVDEPLINKYAGHAQLSTKYEFIENFRIQAIEHLIDSQYFIDENTKQLVLQTLAWKKQIWEQGAKKRVHVESYET